MQLNSLSKKSLLEGIPNIHCFCIVGCIQWKASEHNNMLRKEREKKDFQCYSLLGLEGTPEFCWELFLAPKLGLYRNNSRELTEHLVKGLSILPAIMCPGGSLQP